MFPRRFITYSAEKYTAVCFIYDGKQYQNLCREQGPDGSYNYSEKCLSKLPYNLPFIGFDPNSSSNDNKGLVPYNPDQAEFPDVLSAISHYWFEVLILCLISAITFHMAFVMFRRRSARYRSLLHFYSGGWLGSAIEAEPPPKLSAGPILDAVGNISIGKLAFNPKTILGYGSKGTCVFRGTFEGSSKCAVKRVVSQYLNLADREVEFLRSLQNPNLVRYLATEEDAQFIYIALELAEFSLGDLIEANRTTEIGLSKEDLCHQAALGLQYLHKMDIVHRDIKPQNILVSFPLRPNNERKVLISDFGLSKHLSNLDTGHTSSALRYFDGTQGWMAPEIIVAKLNEDKTLTPTKSADIFSLGCVFYYILSNGQHPFGKSDQRQANILKNLSILDSPEVKSVRKMDISEESAAMAFILIRTMIQAEPQDRPPISCILKYPFFWSHEYQLQFLQDVSDRIDKEEGASDIIRSVERRRERIVGFSWKECLSEEVLNDIGTFRKYNEKSIRHLLRAIRNKRHHYRELSAEVKKSLGDIPDEFMTYFNSRFPELLPHVYKAMQLCKKEGVFRNYYEQIENFIFN